MEVAGEVEEADQMSRSYAVKNVLEEIAVRLEGSEPRFTRKAWHMPVAVVRALEEAVLDRELTRFVRAYSWFRLLKLWAGLRFSDGQRAIKKERRQEFRDCFQKVGGDGGSVWRRGFSLDE